MWGVCKLHDCVSFNFSIDFYHFLRFFFFCLFTKQPSCLYLNRFAFILNSLYVYNVHLFFSVDISFMYLENLHMLMIVGTHGVHISKTFSQ